jgi:hypothetical protein
VFTPYIPYLIRRWHESGAHTDSVQLWHEIRALGYTHSARTVCRFITQLRRAAEAGRLLVSQSSPYTRLQGPSARAVSFAIVCPAAKRSSDAQMYVDQLCQMDTRIAQAHGLTQALLALVRERRGEDLEAWMAEATRSGIAELARCARGLQDDLPAIKAGLTLAWSNEHVAYCTSSPASWPFDGTDLPATTAWRERRWGYEHTGSSIIIARPGNPATAIPVPHGLFAHAQARCDLCRRSHTRVPSAGQPILQAMRSAELGDMHGLEWQPRKGAICLRVQLDSDLGIRRGVQQAIERCEGVG